MKTLGHINLTAAFQDRKVNEATLSLQEDLIMLIVRFDDGKQLDVHARPFTEIVGKAELQEWDKIERRWKPLVDLTKPAKRRKG